MARNDLQGSLDLLVLKTLSQMGKLHGYGIVLHISFRVIVISAGLNRFAGSRHLVFYHTYLHSRSLLLVLFSFLPIH